MRTPFLRWPLLATLLVPSALHAQPADPGSREAEARYQEGRELYRVGRFEDARVKFAQACAAKRTEKCSKNLGMAEYELHHYADATQHLADYLATAPKTDAVVQKIQKLYDECFSKSGHVEVDAPPGAQVLREGQVIGTAPLPGLVHVMPGTYLFTAKLTDGREAADAISPGAGETIKVHLIPREHAAVPSATAVVVPTAPPAASGSAPPASTSTPPTDRSFWNARTTTGVTLGVVAVGALGVGTGFVLSAGGKSSDADAFRAAQPGACRDAASPACAQYTSILDEQQHANTMARIFVAGGLALGVASAVLLLWPHSETRDTALLVVPAVETRGGGVHVLGHF